MGVKSANEVQMATGALRGNQNPAASVCIRVLMHTNAEPVIEVTVGWTKQLTQQKGVYHSGFLLRVEYLSFLTLGECHLFKRGR